MSETRKKRTIRTSRIQYVLYLDELETNEALRENKFNAEDPQVIKNSWEKLCLKLNATGGAIKSISEWKRTFSDWKAHVRKRARNLRAAKIETGNVGQPEKCLTDIEERLLSLTGKLVVEGLPVPELGVPQPDGEIVIQVGVAEPSTSRQAELGISLEREEVARAPTTTPRFQGIKRPRGSLTQSVINNEVVEVLKSIDNTLKAMLEIKKRKFELTTKDLF